MAIVIRWLNSEIGVAKLLVASTAVFALLYVAATLSMDSHAGAADLWSAPVGMVVMLAIASVSALTPILGGGVPLFDGGLTSAFVGVLLIALILTVLCAGLYKRQRWYGKLLSFIGVSGWFLLGIACLPLI
jgi:hypothetical protein